FPALMRAPVHFAAPYAQGLRRMQEAGETPTVQ
ncbi:protein-export chaperone SecB, partial [Pseudomonas syringae]